ncbi:MAG: hypothetical protein MI746_00545 [Pseudomonadales bacterium]|nr:hypothetical protein [Pseudomonadales bacterium]
MPELNFARIKTRLLIGGMAPKYASRTIEELKQHYEDLYRAEKTSGTQNAEASANAFQQLGDEDVLVQEALSKTELLSWAHRFPKLVYLGAVPSLYCLLLALYLALLLLPVLPFVDSQETVSVPWWLRAHVNIVIYSFLYAFTPLLTAAIFVFARKRGSQMLWPLVSIGFLIVFSSAWWVIWRFGTEARPEISFTLGWGYNFLYFPGTAQPTVGWTAFILGKVTANIALIVALAKFYKPFTNEELTSTS